MHSDQVYQTKRSLSQLPVGETMHTIDISQGIDVGGFHYAVDMSNEAHHLVVANENFGQCDFHRHKISIDNDLTDTHISKTFIHEAIEAVNHVYCDHKIDHQYIQQLSFGLHQVMESLGVRFGK